MYHICLSAYVREYRRQASEFSYEELEDEVRRVDIECPPSNPAFNTPDWRAWRRIVHTEDHKRGLGT